MSAEKLYLQPGERLDDLQINNYKIIQHPQKFCFGMDAVLLSAFAQIRKGGNVLDLGTGTGILPILLAAKTEANHFDALEIQQESVAVIRESSIVLKEHGRLYMVHRPFRLAEIFSTLNQYKLEPKRMCLVHPFIDKEPNMVLIESVKDGNPMLKIEPPVIVYDTPGKYTERILEIYGPNI